MPAKTKDNSKRTLVLASTSRYRRTLLQRLGVPFDVVAPNIDETPRGNETPSATAVRLAEAKARAVAAHLSRALVIGSDQVADLDGAPVGKPGNHERAVAQLRALSGRTVVFHTGVALVRCRQRPLPEAFWSDVASTFRRLSDVEIDAYLRRETPYDCAGAVKSEGLGIALFERIATDDPTALIGLPLIAVVEPLRAGRRVGSSRCERHTLRGTQSARRGAAMATCCPSGRWTLRAVFGIGSSRRRNRHAHS